MTRLAHLSLPASITPDEAVAVWRALCFFLLTCLAVWIADRLDKRSERVSDKERRADTGRRIRDFQATQAQAQRRRG